MAYTVSKKAVVGLFVALGYKAATKWDDKKLLEKVKGLPEVIEEEGMDGVQDDADAKKLLTTILKKVKAEEEFEFTDEAAKGKSKGEDGEKPAKAKKEGGVKKVGVISTIISILCSASEKKPVTKDQIVEKLAAKFPDKDADSMRSTVNVQVPNRIRKDKEIEVQKNENGYWITEKDAAKLNKGKGDE